eukprot:GEMP01042087.1.p1 GENE.GEMP01042087.1~~GEMP01042087.1.p1  ORF type:complete len:113 (-),score=5.95 GEMP01042087.1:75-413(-)
MKMGGGWGQISVARPFLLLFARLQPKNTQKITKKTRNNTPQQQNKLHNSKKSRKPLLKKKRKNVEIRYTCVKIHTETNNENMRVTRDRSFDTCDRSFNTCGRSFNNLGNWFA